MQTLKIGYKLGTIDCNFDQFIYFM